MNADKWSRGFELQLQAVDFYYLLIQLLGSTLGQDFICCWGPDDEGPLCHFLCDTTPLSRLHCSVILRVSVIISSVSG